jgi:hypothetical protein
MGSDGFRLNCSAGILNQEFTRSLSALPICNFLSDLGPSIIANAFQVDRPGDGVLPRVHGGGDQHD